MFKTYFRKSSIVRYQPTDQKQEGGKKSPSGEVALRQLQFEFPLSASWGLEMLDLAMWNLKSWNSATASETFPAA